MLPDDSSPHVPPNPKTPDSETAPTLRCPVCRARQPLQPTCRRCKADLRLLVAAFREVGRLRSRHAEALAQGDQATAAEIADQLDQLEGKG